MPVLQTGYYVGLMPRYSPIDASVPLQASRSDLAALHWSTNGIAADFVLPDDEAHLLRTSFVRQAVHHQDFR